MNTLKGIAFNFPLMWVEAPFINGIGVRKGYIDVILDNGTRDLPTNYVGVDPGDVNMGIAFLPRGGMMGQLWQIKFPSNQTSVQRILNTQVVVREFLDTFLNIQKANIDATAVIENASFGATYGQAALSENRTVIAYLMIMNGFQVNFVPPLSIRKTVLGSGKLKAEDTWPQLAYRKHNDVASALACALYGYAKEL